MPRFVIVGLDDPYNMTPLQPDILGSTGAKLYGMTDLSMGDYVRAFTRKNLYKNTDLRGLDMGRSRARELTRGHGHREIESYFVVLGKEVALAFGISREPRLSFVEVKNNVWVAHLPHPSGLNRWYNEPKNRALATEFMTRVAAVATGREDYDLRDDSWMNTYT